MTYGMQAAEGAIESVELDADGAFAFRTIGDAPALGLCGSGLIDLLAVLGSHGADDPEGRVRRPRADFIDVDAEAGITFSRADGSALAQAKAANTVGQWILLRELGVDPGDVDHLYLAGGFATYVDARNAIEIGFLAPVPIDRIEKVGNASLRGARLLLLSAGARQRLAELIPQIEHVELETDARLLRAVRRWVPVQAPPRSARRLRTPAPELRRGGGRRFEGGKDDAREIRRERRGVAAVRRDRRERPHDARRAPSGAAREARRGWPRVDRVRRRGGGDAPAADPARGAAHAGLPGGPGQARPQRGARRALRRPRRAARPRLPARRRTQAGRRGRAVPRRQRRRVLPPPARADRGDDVARRRARADRRRAALDRLLEPRHHPRRPGGVRRRRASLRC